jgi:hypothetical protein
LDATQLERQLAVVGVDAYARQIHDGSEVLLVAGDDHEAQVSTCGFEHHEASAVAEPVPLVALEVTHEHDDAAALEQ